MPPLHNRSLSTETQVNIIFGDLATLLALLAVTFAAAAWWSQRRRTQPRERELCKFRKLRHTHVLSRD